MTKTVDPDTALATRCLTILRHHKDYMDCMQMSRLLKEDSSVCYRTMMCCPHIEHEKGSGLTRFKAKA